MRILLSVGLVAAALAANASAEAGDDAKARAAIARLVPDAAIESIAPAPMAGWYTAVVNGSDVYVSADGEYLMSGALWKVAQKENLTELARADRRREAIAAVPADHKISFAAEQPRHAVTVFTALDCGYCRKLHEQVAAYNQAGISIEYVLFPRGGLQSPAHQESVSVWCADDRRNALTLAKRGEPVEPKICPNPIAENLALAQKLGLTSTPTIVASDGTVMLGFVPPAELSQRLDAAM